MQTKKRAKPVKFDGLKKIKKEEKPEESKEAEKKEEVEEVTEQTEDKLIEETTKIEEEKPQEEASESGEHIETDGNLVEKVAVEEPKPEEFFSRSPDKYEKKKSIIPYFLIVSFVAFLLGLAFFYGIYYAKINNVSKNLLPKPTAVITKAIEKEIPTPKPLDLSAYSIRVLNGTGTSGIAAKVKILLVDAGFKVGSVGNAENDDFTKTQISANKNVGKEYLEKLKDILKKSYELGTTSTLASEEADVVVTIGSTSAK